MLTKLFNLRSNAVDKQSSILFSKSVKVIAIGAIVASALLGFSNSAYAAKKFIKVNVNGSYISMHNVPAYVEDGATYVPLRFVSEALGAKVTYVNTTTPIKVQIDDVVKNEVTVMPGSKKIEVNGVSKTIDYAPRIEKARTMVPLRVISEGLGATVKWNKDKNSVDISTPWETPEVWDGNDGFTWNPDETQIEYGKKVFEELSWDIETRTLSFNVPKMSGVYAGMNIKYNEKNERLTFGKDYTFKDLPDEFVLSVAVFRDETMTNEIDSYMIMSYEYAKQKKGADESFNNGSLVVLDLLGRKTSLNAVYRALDLR